MPKTKIFIVIIFLLIFTLACNALTSVPQSLPTKYVIAAPTVPPTESNLPLTEADVSRVTLEDALVAYSSGTAVFVDVRSKQAYDAGHIPGATNIQLGEFETNITKLKLPKNQWIITYCT